MRKPAGASFIEEFTGQSATVPDKPSYRDQIRELETYCDPEPQTLKHEPTYKPSGQLSKFYHISEMFWSQPGQQLYVTVTRPKTATSPKAEIRLAIPAYKLAEMGFGIPGEWRWKNDSLNDDVLDVDKLPHLPDPFAD